MITAVCQSLLCPRYLGVFLSWVDLSRLLVVIALRDFLALHILHERFAVGPRKSAASCCAFMSPVYAIMEAHRLI